MLDGKRQPRRAAGLKAAVLELLDGRRHTRRARGLGQQHAQPQDGSIIGEARL
jgi:hypothetical protein